MKTVTLPFEEHEELIKEADRFKEILSKVESSKQLILLEKSFSWSELKITKGEQLVKTILRNEFEKFESNMKDLKRIQADRDKRDLKTTVEVFRYKRGAITKTHAIILYAIIIFHIAYHIFS